MPISEGARQDLYSGLVEVLGPQRAEVLMACLPNHTDDLATKPDLDALGSRVSGLDTRVSGLDTRVSGVETRLSGVETRLSGVETRLSGVETRLSGVEAGLVGVNQRLDRLFLTLLAGMLGVLTALAGAFVAGTLV